MRVGVTLERKEDYEFLSEDPLEADSELFSHEEEDALLSGLRDAGHEVVRIGDGRRLVERVGFWRNRCDLVFNLSVGYRGLDRKSYVPGVLELAGIPYVGSQPYALSLTRHKYHAKLVAAAAGVATASAVLWSGEEQNAHLDRIAYPAIVKPVAESSSIGIEAGLSVVSTAEAAAARARVVVDRLHQPALIETFVFGTEVEVPLVGYPLSPLGVVGITQGGVVVEGEAHLAAASVYEDGYGFLTPVPGLDQERVMDAAVTVADAVGIRDYGRIDFRVTPEGIPIFLEASTHPHIQHHSSFFELARGRGLTYADMLDEIVATATHRIQS
jgi:D-alanine-D-alanine ligase